MANAGTEVHRPEGSHIPGSHYRRAWAGNWTSQLTLSPLDEEHKPGRIHHRPDLSQPTVWKMEDFGGGSCHRVWSQDHKMGGGHGEEGESRRQTRCRVEPGGHVTGRHRAGWETQEREGKGKSILWSGEHRQWRWERSRVLPGSTGQGTQRHCQGNENLCSVKKMVEWRDYGDE